ncbi:peptidoglycan-associated lipoprotein Pal [Marinimicrobium sp. C2-29]|uniref:peptidoglycan-associated lipoprotein Pal n=1 Tax=Marinimicrobium sp. C2-29 TaxID=3139825 RepID=UPI003138F980
MTKLLKQGLSLAFVMAFLAGCASTDTSDEEGMDTGESAERDGGVTTGTSDREGVSSRSGDDDEMEELDTIVYFDFDQATLKPEARALLLAHAERLKDSPTDVRLEGHTDERGSREYNMALGERRAKAVRDFLVLQGVRRDDLEVVSYGEERPLAMGSNDSAWAKNRRVEIKY